MTSDRYITVVVKLIVPAKDAVLLAQGQHQAWIPRSLIYGPDEIKIEERAGGDEFKLRIFEWKAREAGLVEAHAGQRELF